MSTSESLMQVLRHNAWANTTLYAACEELSDAQLDATAVGTFGSVRATLLHIAGAQERYVAALSQSAATGHREREPFTGVADLRREIEASSVALIDLAARLQEQGGDLPDATVTTPWRGTDFTLPVWLVLLQVINHATEHRAQIAVILTQLGIQPPSIDGWTFHETHSDADWSQLWTWNEHEREHEREHEQHAEASAE